MSKNRIFIFGVHALAYPRSGTNASGRRAKKNPRTQEGPGVSRETRSALEGELDPSPVNTGDGNAESDALVFEVDVVRLDLDSVKDGDVGTAVAAPTVVNLAHDLIPSRLLW